MLGLLKYTLQGLFSLKTAIFLNKLDNFLSAVNTDKAKMSEERKEYLISIGTKYEKLKLSKFESHTFIRCTSSYKNANDLLFFLQKLSKADLRYHIGIREAEKLLAKEGSMDSYLNTIKYFNIFRLYENEQGNLKTLVSYKIPSNAFSKIVNIMIETKNAGIPLTQRELYNFYIANRPHSENLDDLKKAWLAIKHSKRPITIEDLIYVIKFKRTPLKFVQNYNKIVKSEIDVSLKRFKTLNISQKDITTAIDTVVKLRALDVYLDFEVIYAQVSANPQNVEEAVGYLIEFNNAGFKFLSYNNLMMLKTRNVDLLKLLKTLLYNRKNKVINEKTFFDKFTKILSARNKVAELDSFTFLRAIEMEINRQQDLQDFVLTEREKIEIVETVYNEYLIGLNVFEILSFVNKVKSHDINISYEQAKAFCQQKQYTKNELLEKAINPFMLHNNKKETNEDGTVTEKPVDFHVVTKDHVEIIIHVQIQAILRLERFFDGSGKDVLFHRVYAILLNQIQQRYNHDEIIVNIEKISNNVLYELNRESKNIHVKRIPEKEMKRIENHGHGHDSHKIAVRETEHHSHKTEKETSTHAEHTEHQSHTEHSDYQTYTEDTKYGTTNEKSKFNSVSKYKPLKILIPKIEFVKASFKEYEKIKEQHQHHIEAMHLELENVKTDIKVKEAWAKGDNLKYKFLDNENIQTDEHSHHHRQNKK